MLRGLFHLTLTVLQTTRNFPGFANGILAHTMPVHGLLQVAGQVERVVDDERFVELLGEHNWRGQPGIGQDAEEARRGQPVASREDPQVDVDNSWCVLRWLAHGGRGTKDLARERGALQLRLGKGGRFTGGRGGQKRRYWRG